MRYFYFFLLFLLSRKFRNATTKPPKVQSKVNIPMNIEIISKAVIITHLPSYVFRQAGWLAREATILHSVPVGAKLTSTGRHAPCHGYSSYVFPRKNIISFYTNKFNIIPNISSYLFSLFSLQLLKYYCYRCTYPWSTI